MCCCNLVVMLWYVWICLSLKRDIWGFGEVRFDSLQFGNVTCWEFCQNNEASSYRVMFVYEVRRSCHEEATKIAKHGTQTAPRSFHNRTYTLIKPPQSFINVLGLGPALGSGPTCLLWLRPSLVLAELKRKKTYKERRWIYQNAYKCIETRISLSRRI